MILKKDIIQFYEYFYKKKFNSAKYNFKPSEKSLKVIDTFLSLLDKNFNLKLVGKSFLFDYFIYQFNYWRNANLVAFHGKFRIELIIGRKAFLRYKDNVRDDLWVIQSSEIYKLYNLIKSDLIPSEKHAVSSFDHELGIKKMKFNTIEGFNTCITATTMYNHQHTVCILCNYKKDCKKILKENYPKLYEIRGY
jgi:hypothetical protein